jgi:hypothetical protein
MVEPTDNFINEMDDMERGAGPFDMVRELLTNPLVIGIIAFLIGTIFGLVVLGWGPLKVKYYDAAAEHLRADLQEDYARMVIDSYTLTGDQATALRRLNELGDLAPEVMAKVASNPQTQRVEHIYLLQQLIVPAAGDVEQPTPGAAEGETPATADTTAQPSLFDRLKTPMLLACAVTFILVSALVIVFFLRSRRSSGEPSAAARAQVISNQIEHTNYEELGAEPPLAQWMTTYLIGDDLFDDSFSIDSPTGEFMGECGVGIADTIGVGDPKRVSAFEIWLFDKNDIQTVTKVLMSDHAYNDASVRDRLAAKGEPIVARPGEEINLQTASLHMVARVVDMAYGEGALPSNSFFERISIELAIWPIE